MRSLLLILLITVQLASVFMAGRHKDQRGHGPMIGARWLLCNANYWRWKEDDCMLFQFSIHWDAQGAGTVGGSGGLGGRGAQTISQLPRWIWNSWQESGEGCSGLLAWHPPLQLSALPPPTSSWPDGNGWWWGGGGGAGGPGQCHGSSWEYLFYIEKAGLLQWGVNV